MARRIKNHHYVPKVLQKRFCFRGNEIWFSRKGEDGKFTSPELTLTDHAFKLPNYYTVLDGDEYSDVVEKKFYGRIDNYLGEIIPDCIDALSKDVIPVFKGAARVDIAQVMFALAKRTPDFYKRGVPDEALGKEATEKALALTGLSVARHETLMDRLQKPDVLRSIGRDIRVRATLKSSDEVDSLLSQLVVRWAVSESRSSFLLASSIVYRIGNGGPNGLSNPNFEMWMPISPKIALVMCRDNARQIPLRNTVASQKVRDMNEHAAKESFQVGSQSQKLIESVTGARSRFGEMPRSERGLASNLE